MGQDLHDIAILEFGMQRDQAAVHLRPHTAVPHLGMNGKRKIHRCGMIRQGNGLAPGRQHRNPVTDIGQATGQVTHEVFGRPLGHIQDGLAQHLVHAGFFEGGHLAFLVLPVGGNALLRDPMHFLGAHLDFEEHTVIKNQRGVQGAVAVILGLGHKIPPAVGNIGPQTMKYADDLVAVTGIVIG